MASKDVFENYNSNNQKEFDGQVMHTVFYFMASTDDCQEDNEVDTDSIISAIKDLRGNLSRKKAFKGWDALGKYLRFRCNNKDCSNSLFKIKHGAVFKKEMANQTKKGPNTFVSVEYNEPKQHPQLNYHQIVDSLEKPLGEKFDDHIIKCFGYRDLMLFIQSCLKCINKKGEVQPCKIAKLLAMQKFNRQLKELSQMIDQIILEFDQNIGKTVEEIVIHDLSLISGYILEGKMEANLEYLNKYFGREFTLDMDKVLEQNRSDNFKLNDDEFKLVYANGPRYWTDSYGTVDFSFKRVDKVGFQNWAENDLSVWISLMKAIPIDILSEIISQMISKSQIKPKNGFDLLQKTIEESKELECGQLREQAIERTGQVGKKTVSEREKQEIWNSCHLARKSTLERSIECFSASLKVQDKIDLEEKELQKFIEKHEVVIKTYKNYIETLANLKTERNRTMEVGHISYNMNMEDAVNTVLTLAAEDRVKQFTSMKSQMKESSVDEQGNEQPVSGKTSVSEFKNEGKEMNRPKTLAQFAAITEEDRQQDCKFSQGWEAEDMCPHELRDI